jgi:hypothetical protein
VAHDFAIFRGLMWLVALSLNGLVAVNAHAQLNFRATYFEMETS